MTEVVAANTLTGVLTVLHTQTKGVIVHVCGSGTQVVPIPISGTGTYSKVPCNAYYIRAISVPYLTVFRIRIRIRIWIHRILMFLDLPLEGQ
jgi:hypothetical protein